MSTSILFGPPGTGKTHSLLQIVHVKLLEQLSPDQVCFISFTRKAANEAKYRACDKFHLQEEQLPWFSTLHSLAFRSIGLSRNSVMGLGDYKKLCDMLGLTITYKTIVDDGTFASQTTGDRLFFAESMARARMMTLREYWEIAPNEDIYFYQLEQLQVALSDYKKSCDKVDFIDIIHRFIDSGDSPPCAVLILDEAQDLSPLQWRMVEKLAKDIPECYIAGDDDQAIFRWAGADVDHLIKLPGTQEVLGKSFRVPRKVQELATTVVERIQNRVPKQWDARDADGKVEHVNSLDDIDMSSGTWLLLARNTYLLDNYIHYCMREGYIFDCPKEGLLKRDSFVSIRDWETLRGGGSVPASSIKLIYDLMTVRVGVAHGFKGKVADIKDRHMIDMAELRSKWGLVTDATWHVALDKMPAAEAQYFKAAQERGEKFSGTPRIRISSIHGAKGGEADNVILQTDMAQRTYAEMQENPDDEHRVWYVAITRTKENLFIISPQSGLFYDI